jgi:ABC-type cobalamin transport system permease subunit
MIVLVGTIFKTEAFGVIITRAPMAVACWKLGLVLACNNFLVALIVFEKPGANSSCVGVANGSSVAVLLALTFPIGLARRRRFLVGIVVVSDCSSTYLSFKKSLKNLP